MTDRDLCGGVHSAWNGDKTRVDGKVHPRVEGAIVNPETGERVKAGEKGVIAVVKNHPMLFKGYHKKEEKNR